jgi:hypothetical protein
LGLPAVDAIDLSFDDLGFDDLSFDAGGIGDFGFGIAFVRRGAVVRFVVFRPRLAIFPFLAKSLANPGEGA